MQVCYKCNEPKDLEKHFSKNKANKTGFASMCKSCNKLYSETYYKKNNNSLRNRRKTRYKKDPLYQRTRNLLKYNISFQDFCEMQKMQENKCLICKKEFSDKVRPYMDHDHTCCPDKCKSCGKCLRGILCNQCNQALGYFKDDPTICRAAADYLEIYKNLLTTALTPDRVVIEVVQGNQISSRN